MKSKTIILSQEKSSGRGILTLYVEDGLLKAKLRLYQVEKLNQYCKLAVYHKQQVFSANLIFKNGVYLSSLVGDWDMDEDFYTAIVDAANNNNIVISGGSYAGYFFEDSNVFDDIGQKNQSANETEKDTNCESECCDKCATCKYKEYFYANQSPAEEQNLINNNDEQGDNKISHQSILENDIEKQNTIEEFNADCTLINEQNLEINHLENNTAKNLSHQDENDATENQILNQPDTDNKTDENLNRNDAKIPTILESLLPQFDYIFKNYAQNEELTNLIPNSKFVAMDENGDNYSLGAIYENDKMKYICYAVRCNYNTPAPEELGKFYQWLPINAIDPLSEGYYIVYQDANDLKIIEV